MYGVPKKGKGDVPGPALQSFTLTPDTFPADQAGATTVSFEVGLDRPAPPGGVQVDISGPFGAAMRVDEGQSTGSQQVTPTVMPAGDYELVARLGEVSKAAVLRIVP
jgi:hypothetical protein